MDPFSIAGTLIAIVQITSAVISICYDYRSSAKNATQEIVQITDELNSLRDVLESLLRLVEKAEADGNGERMALFNLLLREGGLLNICQQELLRLKGKLDPGEGWRKVKSALVWPLKEGEMKRALGALERLKATLLLALSTDQTAMSLAIRDEVRELTQAFQRHSTAQQRPAIHAWLAGPCIPQSHCQQGKKTGSDGRLVTSVKAIRRLGVWFKFTALVIWNP